MVVGVHQAPGDRGGPLSVAGSDLDAQERLAAGGGMLLLPAFAPFALFKLMPSASLAASSSLEGSVAVGRGQRYFDAARKAPSGLQRGPRLIPLVGTTRHLRAAPYGAIPDGSRTRARPRSTRVVRPPPYTGFQATARAV